MSSVDAAADNSIDSNKSLYPTLSPYKHKESLLAHSYTISKLTLHKPKSLAVRFDIWLYVLLYAVVLSISLPAIVYEYNRAPDVIHDDITATSNTNTNNTLITPHTYNQPNHTLSTLKSIFDDEIDIDTDTVIDVIRPITYDDVPATNSAADELIDPLTGLRRLTAEELADMPSDLSFAAMFIIPFVIASHLALLLSTYWNMNIQSAIKYHTLPIHQLNQATHIKVIPVANSGIPAITSILHDKSKQHTYYFEYQKIKYFWNANDDTNVNTHTGGYFSPAILPLQYPLSHYINWSGFDSLDSQISTSVKYGENYFDVPLPEFMDLFYEHAMAPFFVFQVFCVLLWCLDEYWYYSMLTLLLLVAFEGTLVKRRQKNLEDLRAMRQKPYVCYVYRQSQWIQMSTDHIYPNDVISLTASSKQLVCPADILLLSGNTVVNEALLTGESVPQIKEAIEPVEDYNELLNINKLHKRSVVFGGTKVMLCNSVGTMSNDDDTSTNTNTTSLMKTHVPSPPDNGCIGYVLRTGFHTSQGELVRTILFNTEHVSVNNGEAILFIGFLLIFAIVAAAYVLYHGLQDSNRSRYKLLLNCIMIVTSVVPPELPMELSLAVNTSLLQLARALIYCTEPFRIPIAGAIDVCAFDKTGTLTSDNFVVKGIAAININSKLQSPPQIAVTLSAPPAINTNTSNLANAAANKPENAAPAIQQREYTAIDKQYGLTLPSAVNDYVRYVISGCHSLVSVDDKLVGDPLETAAIRSIGYNVDKNSVSTGKLSNGQLAKLRIIHRYAFNSTLKRMSCIIALEHDRTSELYAVVKGAAEVLQDRLIDLPGNYLEIVNHYSRQGCRVLALGYKALSGMYDNNKNCLDAKQLPRQQIECDLLFAGLLVLEVPMKSDSAAAVQQLIESNHHVIMITGDNTLTACSVARELLIADKSLLVLNLIHQPDNQHILQWTSVDNSAVIPFDSLLSAESLKQLVDKYDLCLSGDSIEHLLHMRVSTTQLTLLFRCSVVYARTSPDQKELIIRHFKQHGLYTLMCGDGTNDVGALKQAHIGVALIASPEPITDISTDGNSTPSTAASAPNTMQQQIDELRAQSVAIQNNKQLSFTQKMSQQAAIIAKHKELVQKMSTANAPPKAPSKPLNEMSKQELQQFQKQQISDLLNSMDDGTAALVKLGDASIASPFTSKRPFVSSCIDIIRQGRCTLVTTLQMFNILGINCLMSAYSMSVLYLDGVKYGDYQMTISGLSIAVFFMCLSNTKPVNRLSPHRPDTKLFSIQMLLSVAGQWCIHMLFLLTVISSAELYVPKSHEHRIIEKKFSPNILNTVVFLLSNTTTVTTFVCNYRGQPFMQGLSSNTNLKRALTLVFGLCMLLVSDYIPELNYMLELVPMPNDNFRYTIIGSMLGDMVVTYMYVRIINHIFAKQPQPTMLTHRYRSVEHQREIQLQQQREAVVQQSNQQNQNAAPSFREIFAKAKEQARLQQQAKQAELMVRKQQ